MCCSHRTENCPNSLAPSVGMIIRFSDKKKSVIMMNTCSKYTRKTRTTQDDAGTWNDPHAQISRCYFSRGV
jgi:hypothetical protein